jgi:hypothetical protein
MSQATLGAAPTRRLTVSLLLLALLAALVPLSTAPASAADLDGWSGYVWANPSVVRPDVAPPRVDLHADGSGGLFAAGATVAVRNGDTGEVVGAPLPLDVTDAHRATFTPPVLAAGYYELDITSAGHAATTVLDVAAPQAGGHVWFHHDEVAAGATEVALTASAGYLDGSTRISSAVRFRDGDEVPAGARFEHDDAARGRVVLDSPLGADDELHLEFTDDQGLVYGDVYLWARGPGATLRADRFLVGSTLGATLVVDPFGFTFDGPVTAKLRTYGRVLPAGALGAPSVGDDGSLRVPIAAELPAGWYELQLTVDGERFELYLDVAAAGAELWTEDLVRDRDTGTAWFAVEGLGQRWDATTTVTLRDGSSTIATATGLGLDTYGDQQVLDGAMPLPDGLVGIRTLRVTTGSDHVDLPVRVGGPKLWVDAEVDRDGGEVSLYPDGFRLEAGSQVTVRTDTGRTVLDTTVSAEEAEWGWFTRPLAAASNVALLTATVTQGGTSYTGRAFNGWGGGDLDVTPATSPAGSRPTSLDLRPAPGTFGAHLLSSTERWSPTSYETVTAPLPTRVGDRLARQGYPGGLADGWYDLTVSDGDLTWFGMADVGDLDWTPNLEVVPYQHPSGTGAGKVLTVRSTDFPFAAGTTAILFDEDGDEVPGGVQAVQVVDQRTLRITLGARLDDGYHAFEVDVNGGYDYADFLVGEDEGWEPEGPLWATNAALSVSNLAATSLTLSWPAASTDAGPVTYTVHRGSTKVAGPTTNRSAAITGLTADTPYTFSVRATDASGVTSTQTLQTTVRTKPAVVAPSPADPPTCAGTVPLRFGDVPSTYTHAEAVGCAAGLGLVLGKAGGGFDPNGTLTRGQLASIVLRSLEKSNVQLTGERSGFRDIAGSPHETAIRKLSAAGVIQGKSDTVFDPQGNVTRGQLMTLLDRASKLMVQAYPEVSGPRFGDTSGSPHAGAIDRLNAAGIAQGLKDGRSFGPNLSVNRGQAASFVTRWLEDQASRRTR